MGELVFEKQGALREQTKVFDAEMIGLSTARETAKLFILNGNWTHQLTQIIFYADNTAALTHIYKGTPGKAQAQSLTFRSHIGDILNEVENALVAISWVPGHTGIAGNKKVDQLAKEGTKRRPDRCDFKTQAFVSSLHKREMLEAWTFRWSNHPNLHNSGFHSANTIAPTLSPTPQFINLEHKSFSCLIQFRTGHAHIGEYYSRFVRSEDPMCGCGQTIQTRQHILKECLKYLNQ